MAVERFTSNYFESAHWSAANIDINTRYIGKGDTGLAVRRILLPSVVSCRSEGSEQDCVALGIGEWSR